MRRYKGKVTKALALALAGIMVFGSLELSAYAAEETELLITSESVVPEVDIPDNEELLKGYLEQIFYGNNNASVFAVGNNTAGYKLTGDEKLVYDALIPFIEEIASGTRNSTEITLGVELTSGTITYPVDTEVTFTGLYTDFSLQDVINALLTDYPYEMYWYDKLSGCNASVLSDTEDNLLQITLPFEVADNYQGISTTYVDGTIAMEAVISSEHAHAIVEEFASVSDFEKLTGYRDRIMYLVSYDSAAAEGNAFSTDNDPWQLIHVFDNDSETNVVCEGYAKAFQYLCDLSDFDGDIACYSVTGDMSCNGSGGGHMWNVVTIGDANYLVDVTNSDTDTVGSDGTLFLAGTRGSIAEGYTFTNTASTDILFKYDEESISIWGSGDDSILKLSDENFDEAVYTDISIDAGDLVAGASGTGWSVDEDKNLTLDTGYSFTFTGDCSDYSIMNSGTIYDGDFSGYVYNDGTIVDGTYSGEFYNAGIISGGTFTETCSIGNSGEISGGSFECTVYNSGEIWGSEVIECLVNEETGKVNLASDGEGYNINIKKTTSDEGMILVDGVEHSHIITDNYEEYTEDSHYKTTVCKDCPVNYATVGDYEEHSIAYSVSGATISAKCLYCEADIGSYAIEAPSDTVCNEYNKCANVTGSIYGVVMPDITYSTENGEAPIYGGTYTASITLEDTFGEHTATVEFTINHADEDEDGRCDGGCGTYMDGIGANLAGYTISLNGNIGVNFYMELDTEVANDDGAYMLFTLPNGDTKQISVADATPNTELVAGKTYYVFSCEVASYEMTQAIKAQMFDGNGNSGTEYSYTVRDYAEYIIDNPTAYTSDDVAFAKAMLNYGASAQEYFNVAADDLANKNLSEEERAVEILTADELSDYMVAAVNNDLGAFSRYSLVLKSETTLKVYFKPVAEAGNLTFTVNGAEIEPVQSGEYYILSMENIKAWELDTDYTFGVSDGNTELEFSCCALSYGYSLLSKEEGAYPDTLIKLISALYAYQQKSEVYIN